MESRVQKQVLLVGVIALLGGGVVYAELKNGYYRPGELGSIQQSALGGLTADANYDISAFTMYPPELEAGEGRQEVQTYCNNCHGLRYITMQPPLPAATWEAEVVKMNKAYGAALPDPIAAKIVQYLQTHYAPENRKH
jgi:mono/diheme cytochrome c family protein